MKRPVLCLVLALAAAAAWPAGPAWARGGFHFGLHLGHGHLFHAHRHHFHHPFRHHHHFFHPHRFFHQPWGPVFLAPVAPPGLWGQGFWRWDGFQWVWVAGPEPPSKFFLDWRFQK